MKSFFDLARKAVAKAVSIENQGSSAPVPISPAEQRAADCKAAKEALEHKGADAISVIIPLAAKHERVSEIHLCLARALLRHGDMSAAHLKLLASCVWCMPPAERTQLEKKLQPSLAIHKQATPENIRNAEMTAELFKDCSDTLRGISRTMGVAALRLRINSPDSVKAAIVHFKKAIKLDPADSESKEGLKLALHKAGRIDDVIFYGGNGSQIPESYLKTLKWLEAAIDTPEPPLSSDALRNLQLDANFSWERDFAIARLCLIEGENGKAATLLQRLAESKPDANGVSYYGAWADLLSGCDESVLEAWLEDYEDWSGSWVLLSRLWDLNPSAKTGLYDRVLNASEFDPAQLLQARMALAFDQTPPPTPARSANSVEEEIESLRIRLGQACCRVDVRGLTTTMASQLFLLLPKADRLYWRAMQEHLTGAPEKSRATFETAAQLGHRRAAWAASVIRAESGDLAGAKTWSQTGLGHRKDDRSGLWNHWLDAASGNTTAQESLLNFRGSDSDRKSKTVAYAVLSKAHSTYRSGNQQEATRLMEQAMTSFRSTAKTGFGINDEAVVMADCIQFWLNPQRGAPVLSSHWDRVMSLSDSPRRSWLAWMVILAKLTRNDPRNIPEASEELGRLLRKAGTLDEPARTALARSITAATGNSGTTSRGKLWLDSLRALPGGALEAENQLANAASAWQRCDSADSADSSIPAELETQAGTDPQNIALALVAAFALARNGASNRAADLLGRTADVPGAKWLQIVADGLSGHEDGTAVLSADSLSLNLSSTSALLLQALGLFKSNQSEKGFDTMLTAWRLSPKHVPGIFRVSQWVTVICASCIGNVPPNLLGAVKDLGRVSTDPSELDRLAHCAAVLSNHQLAIELWRRAFGAGTTDSPDPADFARFLCHLASIDDKAGKVKQALEWVQEAISILPQSSAPEEKAA